jgi:hypothetical protein
MANPLQNLLLALGELAKTHYSTCNKCRRRYPGDADPEAKLWSVWYAGERKIVTALRCPDCQTDEDRAQLVIREAGGERYKVDGLRLVELPKPPTDGNDDEPQEQTG